MIYPAKVGQDQTPELTPKVALGLLNWANRANKWTPKKKKEGGREVGLACLRTRGAPRGVGESQNLPSATPLPSWRALGSCFPVRKIRFGSSGWLKNLHASDLKGKGAQEKLSTNVKITQPGVCLPRLRWSGDVYELRAGLRRPISLRDFAWNAACAQPRPYVPAAAGRRARWNQGEEIITVNLFDFCSSPRAQPSPDTSNQPRPLALAPLPPTAASLHLCAYIYKYIYIIFKEEKLLFPLPVAGFH